MMRKEEYLNKVLNNAAWDGRIKNKVITLKSCATTKFVSSNYRV